MKYFSSMLQKGWLVQEFFEIKAFLAPEPTVPSRVKY